VIHKGHGSSYKIDARLPSEIACALGFAVVVSVSVVLGLAGSVLVARTTTDLAVLALAVAALSYSVRPLAAFVTAGLAWLMLNGFLIDHFGVLTWHGVSDITRLLALVAAAIVPIAIRAGRSNFEFALGASKVTTKEIPHA
jgi:hypothetical protein